MTDAIEHEQTADIICPTCGESYSIHDIPQALVVTCCGCGKRFCWEAENVYSAWPYEEKESA